MSNIIQQFNLPSYIKGKSFAEASKLIQSKFKDREDTVSKNTLNELLNRLKQSQEFIKTTNEPINGSNNEFNNGGDINNVASGAMAGASAGMALGPWGAAIGGVIGGVGGILKNNKKDDSSPQPVTYNNDMNIYGEGGDVNSYSGLNPTPTYMSSNRGGEPVPDFGTLFNNTYLKNDSASAYGAGVDNEYFDNKLSKQESSIKLPSIKPIYQPSVPYLSINNKTENVSLNENKSNENKLNLGSALRYAPIAMNAYQLATMKKPEVERLDRMGNLYKKDYIDERRLMNSINEGFNPGKTSEASGGSLGRYSALNRADQLNKTKAISDAYIKVENFNRAEKTKEQEFNSNISKINLNQSNLEKDINAKNRGAYDTQKSKYLSSLGIDIGQIGKEYLYKNQAENIFGYDWKGNFMKKNPNATEAEVNAAEKKAILELKNKNK